MHQDNDPTRSRCWYLASRLAVLTNQRLIHPTLADRIAAEIGLPKRWIYDRCGDCHPVNAEIDQLIDVRIYNDSQLAGFTSETTGAACPLPIHPESGKGAPDRRVDREDHWDLD